MTHNIIIQSFAKTVNWIDRYIIDAFVNGVVGLSRKVSHLLGHTYSAKAGDNSGAMAVGLLLLLLAMISGGAV